MKIRPIYLQFREREPKTRFLCFRGITIVIPYIAAMIPWEIVTLFVQEMAKRRIHCPTSFVLTLAHTDAEIQQTTEAATDALRVIKRGLEAGNVDSLLECDIKQDPFRRQVT